MSDPAVPSPTPTPARGRDAWVERLQRFAQSGLTPAQFCAHEKVSLPAFYSWRRRLAGERAMPADERTTLLPVRLAAPVGGLELTLPGGAVLRIPAGADEDTLRCLLRLLGVRPC